jgi:hypothetical protein
MAWLPMGEAETGGEFGEMRSRSGIGTAAGDGDAIGGAGVYIAGFLRWWWGPRGAGRPRFFGTAEWVGALDDRWGRRWGAAMGSRRFRWVRCDEANVGNPGPLLDFFGFR